MMFAAMVGHCFGRAPPSLRNAPPWQSMEIVCGETIYRNRNAVQTNPATSLLSLRFRNPEGVKLIKSLTMAERDTCPEDLSPAAAGVLMKLIDNKQVGPIIQGMNWRVVSLKRSRISLLTSDRPLDMPPVELVNKDAYIALPLGPALLFIAEHGSRYFESWVAAASTDAAATRLVKDRNQFVVEGAHEFVWGLDDSQLRFVCNRMGQRQAIDVALAAAARHFV